MSERAIGKMIRLAACLVAPLLLAGSAAAQSPYKDKIVALRVTRQFFSEDRPWAKENPEVRDGTAVVISKQLLLTAASIVQNATFIQVEKHGDADWIPARLVHRDVAINLALLTVDQAGFFDDLTPVEIADRAAIAGVVHSVRWKDRQLELSNSRPGRVEVIESPFGSVHHAILRLSTDFSDGGWAEAVFADDRLSGITVTQSGQTAAVVPAEILEAYVKRASVDGEYAGFASFGDLRWQTNTDRALIAYLGLEGEPRGIFIRRVPWGATGCSSLQPRDILLELDGHAIDASGNYNHPHYGQLRFEHIAVEGHAPGDVVLARVFRNKRLIEVEIELRSYPSSARLVPWRRPDSAPPYLVAGGFVFRELDGRYLQTWGSEWRNTAPNELRNFFYLLGSAQSPERRRIIIVSKVLPDAYNIGYHGVENLPVKSINGFEIDSIADAVQAFERPEGDIHRVVFYPNLMIREVILDQATFAEATRSISSAYGVSERLRVAETELPDMGPECLDGDG